MSPTYPQGVEIHTNVSPQHASILNNDALKFLAEVHRKFEPTRQQLLKARKQRQAKIDRGEDLLVFNNGCGDEGWKVMVVPLFIFSWRII